MDYVYNPFIGYGEDRSFQLPPLFPGGGVPGGGQALPGIPGGGQDRIPHSIRAEERAVNSHTSQVEFQAQRRVYPLSSLRAICLPCSVHIHAQ